MTKKEENVDSCSCKNCGCNWWGRILGISLSTLWVIFSVITCLVACGALICSQKAYDVSQDSYNLNVLSVGWEENLQKMINLYKTPEFVKYMTDYTDAQISSFVTTTEDTTDVEDTNSEGYTSLNSLKNIAVEFWTDESALQTCIDEGRYTQDVNDMMGQASTLFWVSGTPGNVIIDRETGNFILISGAYPTEEFVNAINNLKDGAGDFVAWGDEIKTVVEDMLKATPIRGNKDARFTIVEYTELLCPYCQRHSQEGTINAVIEQFPNEVNSVSRHFIIHGDEALQLASAMECIAELNPDAYHKTFEEAFAKWL